ncbi:MAG: hypothetical protein ACOC9U_06435 [bacterium]
MMHEDLLGDLSDCFDQIVGGDTAHAGEVVALIARCEQAIAASTGEVGAWERQALAKARAAYGAGQLQQALLSAKRALTVGRLPIKAVAPDVGNYR